MGPQDGSGQRQLGVPEDQGDAPSNAVTQNAVALYGVHFLQVSDFKNRFSLL